MNPCPRRRGRRLAEIGLWLTHINLLFKAFICMYVGQIFFIKSSMSTIGLKEPCDIEGWIGFWQVKLKEQ
jgi:hypothetical protein